jgi:UDPglucose 6-dehydrogenase
MKVGVIGLGVVGGTMFDCLGRVHDMSGFDIKEPNNTDECMREVLGSDICFVCVPTPTMEDGTQNISAIDDVFLSLFTNKYTGVVVLKSTVLPGTTRAFKEKYSKLRLVHSPEFLTEKSAKQDFLRQNCILASGDRYNDIIILQACYWELLDLKTTLFNPNFIISHNYVDTELAKYIHNTFLATKVSFMNQMYDFAKQVGADYEKANTMAIFQGVIGLTHNQVPGPDGRRGYGGMCFPKDTKALQNMAGETLSILDAAIQYNDKIRKD